METRASHIAVGGFVLLLLIGGLGFVIWFSKFSERTQMASHFVRFLESVQGVNVGSNVLFGGIPIGHVTAINVDPADSSMARIDMTVDATVPIRSNSVATLEAQGFTGAVRVEISRGTEEGTPIKDGAEIPARYTTLQRLFNQAPELIAKGNEVLDGAAKFFTAENIAAAGRILANVQEFKALVADNSGEVGAALDRLAAAGKQISNTNAEFRELSGEMQNLGSELGGQVDKASRDVHGLATLLGTARGNVTTFYDDNRRPIDEFTATGLYELPAMVAEVQLMVQTIKRISAEIAKDPEQYFLQDRQSGYQIPPPARPGR